MELVIPSQLWAPRFFWILYTDCLINFVEMIRESWELNPERDELLNFKEHWGAD